MVTAAARAGQLSAESDLLQLPNFVGTESERSVETHLDSRPAVFIVAGRHHGDALNIQLELGKIGHGRERQADIVHLHSARQQSADQGLLHGARVRSVIMARHDALRHAARGKQFGEPDPDRL